MSKDPQQSSWRKQPVLKKKKKKDVAESILKAISQVAFQTTKSKITRS